MQRKAFLMTALASVPAFAMATQEENEAGEKEPFIVSAGSNRSGAPMMKYMGAHPNDVIISRKDTADALSVFMFTGYGVVGTPLHIHYYQDEFFTVIEGRYRFVCGDLKKELNAGDTIFLPRNIPHQWLQVSDFGKLIYAVNPAGKLEEFFQDANNMKDPNPEKIDQLALKYGMKHIGPPMTL